MKLIKKIALTLTIATATCTNLNAADSNSIKHFGFSTLFGYGSEYVLNKNFNTLDDVETISYGTLLGSLPGLAKELKDDDFSNEDMAFNVIGALSGALLSNYINNDTTFFVDHNKEEKATQVKLAYKF